MVESGDVTIELQDDEHKIPEVTSKRSPERRKSGARTNELYENHKFREMKRERKRQEYELRDCTFSPSIVESRSRSADVIFEQLERDAFDRELRRKQREAQLSQECTFSPNIKKTPHHQKLSRGSAAWESLYQKGVDDSRARSTDKSFLGEKECTFTPRLSRRSMDIVQSKSRSVENSPAKPSPGKVMSRLYDAEALKAAREAREQKRLERELKECTFSPHVRGTRRHSGGGSRSVGSSPSTHNRRRSGGGDGSGFSRLHDGDYNARQQAWREEKLREKQEAEDAELTFRPQINSKFNKNRRSSGGGKACSRRLYDMAEEERERRRQLEDLALERQGCTFRPQITPHKVNGGGSGTKGAARLARMYEEGRAKVERAREGDRAKAAPFVRQEELDECTFVPKINALSKNVTVASLARRSASPPLHKLVATAAAASSPAAGSGGSSGGGPAAAARSGGGRQGRRSLEFRASPSPSPSPSPPPPGRNVPVLSGGGGRGRGGGVVTSGKNGNGNGEENGEEEENVSGNGNKNATENDSEVAAVPAASDADAAAAGGGAAVAVASLDTSIEAANPNGEAGRHSGEDEGGVEGEVEGEGEGGVEDEGEVEGEDEEVEGESEGEATAAENEGEEEQEGQEQETY